MKKLTMALCLPMLLAAEKATGQLPQDRHGSAATRTTPHFTLQIYLRAVAEGNRELAAQQASVSVAQAQVEIAKVFPDPEVTAGISQYDLRGTGNAATSVVGLNVPIELGAKREARIAVARVGVAAAQAELADFFRNLRANAANSYIDALGARINLARKRQTLASVEMLVKVNQQRLRAGDIGEAQLVQSRVEAEQFRAEVMAGEGETRTADLAAIALLGKFAHLYWGQELTWDGDLSQAVRRQFALAALVTFALAHRPDLQSAENRQALARRQLELARANRAINIALGASWQHSFPVGGSVPTPATELLGATVTVPLPFSRVYHGDLAAVRAAEEQAQWLGETARTRVEVEVRQALARYQTAVSRVMLYTRGVLSDADQVLEKTLYNYQRGGATLVEVLIAQRTVNDVYLAYYDALAESAHALVAVEQAAALWDVEL